MIAFSLSFGVILGKIFWTPPGQQMKIKNKMGRYDTIRVHNKGRKWNKMNAIKRPAKSDNPILTKFLKLKYRINDAYDKYGGEGLNTKKDKSWVMKEIKVIRSGGTLDKSTLEYANKLRSDYEKYTI